ncbi:MAG: late control protein [Candidatus Adiutrix sp.]|jgi:phage protein D|nr:late control protein [Candidatus Adiutrix sp.]
MRRAWLEVHYEGANVTADIAADLLSFTFTEKADGEADDISLSLADRDRRWQGPWAPSQGDRIRPVIFCGSWFADGDSYRLDCGEFEEDEDELTSSSGGDVVEVKAVPALVKSSLAGQRKTRSWEGASLSRIGRDIAEGAGLNLVYEASDIPMARTDQRQETDLAFLQRVCTEEGCRLKLSDGNLIIFEGKQADALEPVVITRRSGDSFRARRATADIYSKVEVSYFDPVKGKNIRYEYTPEDAPETGKVLTINQRVESAAQAERVAKAELRAKNAKQKEADWSGMGHPLIRAGGTVRVEGWGKYDGLYAVKEASHAFSDGGAYKTTAKLETALDY